MASAKPVTIAIMIPTKDRRDLLERCLESALNQTVPADEIIVVNDGSIDGTKTFLDGFVASHPTMRVIHREKNGGVNTARNQGIKTAKSDWIANLDDDDEFVPETIATMKARIAELPENFGIAYFNTLIDNGKETFVGGYQDFHGRDFVDASYEDTMLKRGLRGDCRPVYRKTLFTEHGYWFPEAFNGFESIQTTRIARDGYGIRNFPEILTKVNLRPEISHLSFTISQGKAGHFIELHRKQLADHEAFYHTHIPMLVDKYVRMTKLSLRAHWWTMALRCGLAGIVFRIGIGRRSGALPCAIKENRHDHE